MAPRPRPLADRFWEKVDRSDPGGCWLWTGAAKGTTGYGNFKVRSYVAESAHVVAWQLAHGGQPPDGFDVCHTCDVRLCVNPAHLVLGSHLENQRDMAAKGRATRYRAAWTHCVRGHAFTPENTLVSKSGKRGCRECRREYHQRRDAARPKRQKTRADGGHWA